MCTNNTIEWQAAQPLDALSRRIAELKKKQSCAGPMQARKPGVDQNDRFPVYAVNRWVAFPRGVCPIGIAVAL